MPFDGSNQNAKAVAILDELITSYRQLWNKEHTGRLWINLSRSIQSIRSRLKIREDNTRMYILEASKTPLYQAGTLSELDWLLADYASLENILLRARDLASGEPMRKSTWFTQRGRFCNCTPGRAGFLTAIRSS